MLLILYSPVIVCLGDGTACMLCKRAGNQENFAKNFNQSINSFLCMYSKTMKAQRFRKIRLRMEWYKKVVSLRAELRLFLTKKYQTRNRLAYAYSILFLQQIFRLCKSHFGDNSTAGTVLHQAGKITMKYTVT